MLKEHLMVYTITLYILLFTLKAFPSCQKSAKVFEKTYHCSSTEPIGKGGSGIAYLVKDDNEDPFALKISELKTSKIKDSIIYQIQDKLKGSKYIIQYFCIKIDNDYLYEIQEYAPNGSLSNYIKRFKFKTQQKEILKLFYKIAKGVKALHNKRIIHADIKPDNIVIAADGDPKIIDFDTSAKIGTKTCTATTVLYTPPELSSSHFRKCRKKIDIWSLGVTLHYMLYRRYSFYEEIDDYGIITYDRSEIRFDAGTSREIVDIILMMMRYWEFERVKIKEVLKAVKKALLKDDWEFLSTDEKYSTKSGRIIEPVMNDTDNFAMKSSDIGNYREIPGKLIVNTISYDNKIGYETNFDEKYNNIKNVLPDYSVKKKNNDLRLIEVNSFDLKDNDTLRLEYQPLKYYIPKIQIDDEKFILKLNSKDLNEKKSLI